MTNRKLPIGIQTFETLRRENYIYVDKTEYIWRLVSSGRVYFLSRPRRFGKSLLISTLQAYFQGKKELFGGLTIEALENGRGEDAWMPYPVVTFSLSGGSYNDENGLADSLSNTLRQYEELYDLQETFAVTGDTLPVRFANLIRQLFRRTGRPVVILVDEYDKPLLETMTVNAAQEEQNRQLYKSFFSVLKDQDQYLKFVFFTGVTKFSKVSIFSDLNQLRDISLSEEYAGICGITEEEMQDHFRPEIEALAKAQNIAPEEALHSLAGMYDGYHFSKNGPGVYNPFSLLNAFQDRDFGSYWFSTGTPTFLIRKLKASAYTAEDYTEGVIASERSISDYSEDNPDPVPLFYQSGYLTITGWDQKLRYFTLSFPNDEVKYGFLESLTADTFQMESSMEDSCFVRFIRFLESGDAEAFLSQLQALFARIPYPEGTGPSYEREWRNQLFLVFTLLGQNVHCEVHSSHGRADCILETGHFVYLFELKLDRTAEEAMEQIEQKGYAVPYQTDPRKVLKIGVNFSSETRNIADFIIR